jgi:site-specific DNA-cytosine methylase
VGDAGGGSLRRAVSHLGFKPAVDRSDLRPVNHALSVCVFFPRGGFSAGALEAGAEVILGVDSDPVPLKLWSANVSGGTACLATLGNGGDQVDLPPPAPDLHVHASSPCTDLSCARGASATPEDIARGVSMLRWCLDLVLGRGDTSWSIENVSTITTRETLADYTTRFPTRVAFASIDAADHGACQTRVRLIAGPPSLVRKLQEMPSARRVSVREAFTAVGLQPVSTNFKNQTRSRAGGPCMRSVEELAVGQVKS